MIGEIRVSAASTFAGEVAKSSNVKLAADSICQPCVQSDTYGVIATGSMSRVESRRSSGSLPVAFVSAAFAERTSVRFGMALVPVPAHRTGQAHLAHPALGERFTISPTESCLSE